MCSLGLVLVNVSNVPALTATPINFSKHERSVFPAYFTECVLVSVLVALDIGNFPENREERDLNLLIIDLISFAIGLSVSSF